MSHDLLVQMAYSTLSQCVVENSGQLGFSQYGNHYFGNIILQGSKLKKSSGHLLATNRRNVVARCKFLVASL